MGKNATELDEGKFDDFISKGNVVVDFWAPWCGPCIMMAPEFEKAAEEIKNVKFAKVNVDEEQELAQRFEVMSIPTMIFFKDGEIVERAVGAMRKEDLSERVKETF